jgi:hypothetical protein
MKSCISFEKNMALSIKITMFGLLLTRWEYFQEGLDAALPIFYFAVRRSINSKRNTLDWGFFQFAAGYKLEPRALTLTSSSNQQVCVNAVTRFHQARVFS